MDTDPIARGLADVRRRIDDAAAAVGRDPASVTLVVVTKGVEPARIATALACGARDLGENRTHELREKQDVFAAHAGLRWHLIGTLQRNKVKDVTGRVHLIHSVDSEALAGAIGARAVMQGIVQDVLIEVNVSAEATKHGIEPDRARALAQRAAATAGLRVRGLMTIAPAGNIEATRAAFRGLRRLRDEIHVVLADVTELSMGMSGDFEVAVREGATIVRVGSAIFAPRAG